MMTKAELRTHIRQQKQSLSRKEILRRSEILCANVLQSAYYQNAKTIYGYLPFNQEVFTTPLLLQALKDGKQVALPKCHGRNMRFILTGDLSRIQHNRFGVPEPAADRPVAADPRALVLVPGLAFDPQGYRVGYGGGYYDRFLAAEPDHPTIALCYDFQVVAQLPTDPHDIPVDTLYWV